MQVWPDDSEARADVSDRVISRGFLWTIVRVNVHRWDKAWHFLLHVRKWIMAKNRWFFSFYLCRSLAAQGAAAYLVSTVENSDSHTHTNINSPFPVSGLPSVTSCNIVFWQRRKASRRTTSQYYSSALRERAPLQPLFISLWSGKWHKDTSLSHKRTRR